MPWSVKHVRDTPPHPDPNQFTFKRFIQLIGGMAGIALILFVMSGTTDWWQAWVLLGVWTIALAAAMTILFIKYPGLAAARTRRHADTKKFDRIILALYSPLPLVQLAVAALDRRYVWSDLPTLWSLSGLGLLVLGLGSGLGALWVNPHFEATVRIQAERDHKVVSSGPYRLVRHPGYLGVIVTFIAAALLLGSLWALVPAGAASILFVVRTALEDRVLRQELPGYEEYARRVRFRLLPGLW